MTPRSPKPAANARPEHPARRLPAFAIFLLLSLTLYALIHLSVLFALRTWFPSHTLTWLIAALWFISISSLFIARLGHNFFTTTLYRLGVTWMGIVFVSFLVLFPVTIIAIAFGGDLSPLLLVPPTVLVLLALWYAQATRVKRIEVAVGKLPKSLDGYRIVQLTDLHIGEIYGPAFLERVVVQTNSLTPDMIVITGDVFDGGGKTYPRMVHALKGLRAKHGVYFVRGNHDVYEGVAETDAQLRACGIDIIDDDVRVVSGLALCGLSYPTDLVDHKRGILAELAIKAGTKRPRVLLRHEPRDPELAAELGYDLMLSGHTHNGQIWPLSYLVRLTYPFRVGQHRIKQMTLYIGPGVGTWGPPLRLGSRSEITEITLRHLD